MEEFLHCMVATLIEEILLSPLSKLDIFVKNHLAIAIWVLFQFYYIGLYIYSSPSTILYILITVDLQ